MDECKPLPVAEMALTSSSSACTSSRWISIPACRGLHSFPFLLNFSLVCPFPLNFSLICHPYNLN